MESVLSMPTLTLLCGNLVVVVVAVVVGCGGGGDDDNNCSPPVAVFAIAAAVGDTVTSPDLLIDRRAIPSEDSIAPMSSSWLSSIFLFCCNVCLMGV